MRSRQTPVRLPLQVASLGVGTAASGQPSSYVPYRTEQRQSGWDYRLPPRAEASMNIHLTIGPLISLIAGILILVVPRLLNYIVAIYLIVMGLIGLFGSGAFR